MAREHILESTVARTFYSLLQQEDQKTATYPTDSDPQLVTAEILRFISGEPIINNTLCCTSLAGNGVMVTAPKSDEITHQ